MKPSNSIKDAKKTTKGVKRSNSGLTWSRMPKRSKNDGKIRGNGKGFARTQIKLTAIFQKVPTGYIGFVQELPGANTQGATLKEARENLQEAILLVLEANRILADESIKGQEVIRERLAFPA
jgi:predicted RNase H-like HicB family nuclease